MSNIDIIREKITEITRINPNIHLNVALTKPRKLLLKNTPAKITGVYRHIFQIEENSSGTTKSHTLQYCDILTSQISIVELDVDIEKLNPTKKK